MRVGYARVSTGEQDTGLQLDALRAAGCERIFEDVGSGSLHSRPKLDEMIAFVRPGDVVVIWKLDRLGRSLRHLLDLVAGLESRGVGLASVTEAMDTTTPGGRLIFNIFASLAEFERSLIRERAMAGRVRARAQGVRMGRPARELDETKLARFENDVTMSRKDLARMLGVSEATLYRRFQRRGVRREKGGAATRPLLSGNAPPRSGGAE